MAEVWIDESTLRVRWAEPEGGVPRVLTLSGVLDIATTPVLRAALRDRTPPGAPTPLVVDLRDVRFVDSSGLGVLVGTLRAEREHGGDVRLRHLQPQVRKVFDITGLTQVFTIE